MITDDSTLAAFDAADALSVAAARTSDMLRAAAASESDPDIAAEMVARAAVLDLVRSLSAWADAEDGRTVLWCLHTAGRLLSQPDLLNDLAPHVLDLPADEHAGA